ncbi:MAG: SdrD B-like domain-containing protein [Candidatus Eisenbacteria bacterium]
MRNNKGFTLIEVLIVAVIGVIIAGALIYILNNSRRASRIAELESQAQQNARVAIDYITKDLRSLGYGVDVSQGQPAIAYADPYDLVFNANIEPEPDNASKPGYPAAISIASAPASVPPSGTTLYGPTVTYGTGAETIRFTFDSNEDGAIDVSDKGDEDIETSTPNPNDYALGKQVYGFDGGSNGGTNAAFALLRGPDAYPDGTHPQPLFTYWYDNDDDPTTTDVLWGDTDGSGVLDEAEIVALTPVTAANHAKIDRIGIYVIGTARAPDNRYVENQGYRETVMTSEVGIRNVGMKTGFIVGMVFDDRNADGVRDAGETGILGAIVRLNTGQSKTTGADGLYSFRVDPGTYTVTETNPVIYTPPKGRSTTPDIVMVTVAKGTVSQVDFGDRTDYGQILGKVILDENGDGTLDPGEPGVQGVDIALDTGKQTLSGADGSYQFDVPTGSYTITMTVPRGYIAVGPASVNRTLASQGDTAQVNFGLAVHRDTGIINGLVFNDANRDSIHDIGETGIATVPITLDSGDSTVTSASGIYSFTVVPGTYSVTEYDLGGYSSTTINHVTGIVLQTDSTRTVNFGDILSSTLSFQVITLGATQRALCIASGDLNEFKGTPAPEIVLGTKYVSGVSNLNVWKNNYVNSSTPNSSIFGQNPWYSRSNNNEDINAVNMGDTNGDATKDVVTGMTSVSGKTLIWRTATNGSSAGQLPTTPTSSFIAQGLPDVLAVVLSNVDGDSDGDAVLGTQYSANFGRLEVWFNNGSGIYTHDNSLDVYQAAGSHDIGAVRSLAVGNVAGTAASDVVLGTATGTNTGKVEIFRDSGSPDGRYTYLTTLNSTGEVNAVAIRDMLEDTNGDVDIVVGTKTGAGSGRIDLWLNNGDGTFGDYDSTLGYNVPSDTVAIAGEVLCLGVEKFDRDVYPDVVAGIKSSGSYVGQLQIYSCYGYMPPAPTWTSQGVGNVGEVITLTIDDFNMDSRKDIAIGTRTSASQGTVVVFFNTVQ